VTQNVAHFFGGALAFIFFSLEVSSTLHTGWKATLQRIPPERHWLACLMYLLRTSLIVVVGTIGFWQTEPRKLVLIGVGLVVAQLLMRKVDVTILSNGCKNHGDSHKMKQQVTLSENLASADAKGTNPVAAQATVDG
jgi:hypothetical protein